jgi:hypothetical protein
MSERYGVGYWTVSLKLALLPSSATTQVYVPPPAVRDRVNTLPPVVEPTVDPSGPTTVRVSAGGPVKSTLAAITPDPTVSAYWRWFVLRESEPRYVAMLAEVGEAVGAGVGVGLGLAIGVGVGVGVGVGLGVGLEPPSAWSVARASTRP